MRQNVGLNIPHRRLSCTRGVSSAARLSPRHRDRSYFLPRRCIAVLCRAGHSGAGAHTKVTSLMRMRNLVFAILSAGLAVVLTCTVLDGKKQPPAKPIDLNAANVKELQELPGIGRVTAQRIIDMRQKSGRFKRVEDLLAVRGISQKKLDALRPYVKVSSPPPPPSPSKSPPATRDNGKK
jgi:competence ComEA-like helix-hairpin-helix protein